LQDSIDLESLVAFSMDEASNLKQEIERLNGLAQLGITVEIIGHEIEGLETTVTRGLNEMPDDVKLSKAYHAAKTAHESLTERLRFLSPLKLSGERTQLWLEGQKILDYVYGFFGDSLAEKGITLEGTAAFRQFSVYEQPARLYPVFVNLINNAAYWVCQSASSNKQILLDVCDGKVIVADDGPGVEQEDLTHLFSLFFTRKVRGGRGVGLYLCRANLASGGHIISYLTDQKLKKLSGANFAIEFKGAKNV
jgi:signal transduction histidine kinase